MAVHGGSLRSAPTLLYSHMVVEIDQASVGYFGKRMGGGGGISESRYRKERQPQGSKKRLVCL